MKKLLKIEMIIEYCVEIFNKNNLKIDSIFFYFSFIKYFNTIFQYINFVKTLKLDYHCINYISDR